MKIEEAVFELKQIRDVYANMRKEYKSCVEALDTAIKALESQKWILCSERLPEEPIRVMAHLDNGWIITVYRQEEEWITVPDCGEPISDDEVIAWMPLPKAFREGEG